MDSPGEQPRETPPASPGSVQAPLPSGIDWRWPALLSGLIVLLVYLPALGYGFVWDDPLFLRDQAIYRDPALWPTAILRAFVISPNYFRPLALLTFVGELRWGGLNPAVFHAANMLLHAVNTGLVTLLAWYLLGGRDELSSPEQPSRVDRTLAAFLVGTGLLYGLHPALIEGVAFISSRFDLLMTAILLLALWADVALRGRPVRPLAVGAAFLLAALSKEMALAFVLALPFWHLATPGAAGPSALPRWKRIREGGCLQVYAAVLISGLVYLGIRQVSLGYLLVSLGDKAPPVGTPVQHLLLVARSLAEYLLLIIWPFTSLTPIHFGEAPVPVTEIGAWAALVIAVLFGAGLVMLVQRESRAGWLAVAGTVALLPVSNMQRLELGGGAFIAERFLLFPLVFFVLAAGVWLRPQLSAEGLAAWGRATWKPALLVLWLVMSVAVVQLTLPNWRDEMSLWTWAAQRAPRSATPLTNLGLQYTNQGQDAKGLDLAQRATVLDPQNADAWDIVGLALFHLGRYAEAQSAFERATTVHPGGALFWNNLAGSLREQGKLAEAERVLLDQALRLDPNLPMAHLNLGLVYLRADRPDLATGQLQRALHLLPPDQAHEAQALLGQSREPGRWLRLGDVLLAHGEGHAAVRAFEQAGALGAPEVDVAAGLSSALIAMKMWTEADQVLTQALGQVPEDARLYNNLGIVAREEGRLDDARQFFGQAARLAPEWEMPRENLAALPDR